MRDVEKQRKYWRDWYYRNKADQSKKIYFNRAARRIRLRVWLKEWKKDKCCVRCGFAHPAALDFHHRDVEKKEFAISEMLTFSQSIARLKKEIEKCDLLCANCHRIEHYRG